MFVAIYIDDRSVVYCKGFQTRKEAIDYNYKSFLQVYEKEIDPRFDEEELEALEELKQTIQTVGMAEDTSCLDGGFDFRCGDGWCNLGHNIADWYVKEV